MAVIKNLLLFLPNYSSDFFTFRQRASGKRREKGKEGEGKEEEREGEEEEGEGEEEERGARQEAQSGERSGAAAVHLRGRATGPPEADGGLGFGIQAWN